MFYLLQTLSSLALLFASPKEEAPQIKSYIQATYSLRTSEEMSREKALKEQVSLKVLFNKQGKAIEEFRFENDGSIFEHLINKWDSLGNFKGSYTYNADKEMVSNVATVYDEQGNLIAKHSLNEQKEPKYIERYTYDSVGNQLSYQREVISIQKTFTTRYTYNEKSQVIRQTQVHEDGSIKDVRTYKYDSLGNEYFQDYLREDGNYTRFMSYYDSQNRLVDQPWYDRDSVEIHRTSFEYIDDEYGNWISRKRYSNGELNFVWERKITYY